MKKLILFFAAGAVCISSCTETFAPNVDYGDQTYINDYSSLVAAVNDLNLSLSSRIDALNDLVEKGFADIKVSIDENTGAVEVLSSTVEDGMAEINSAILDGFTALVTKIDENGVKTVTAINSNGEALKLAIQANGTLVSTAITGISAAMAELKTMLETELGEMNVNLEAIASYAGQIKGAIDAFAASEAQADKDALKNMEDMLMMLGIYKITATELYVAPWLAQMIKSTYPSDMTSYNKFMGLITNRTDPFWPFPYSVRITSVTNDVGCGSAAGFTASINNSYGWIGGECLVITDEWAAVNPGEEEKAVLFKKSAVGMRRYVVLSDEGCSGHYPVVTSVTVDTGILNPSADNVGTAGTTQGHVAYLYFADPATFRQATSFSITCTAQMLEN